MMLFFICCIINILQIFCIEEPPLVKIPQGNLQGRHFTTRKGRAVSGFLAIPYAAPPLGNLRFQSPQPHSGWEGTRAADKYGNQCAQTNIMIPELRNVVQGSEDCLFLNVFTPQLNPKAYLPVMVWIHAGAFLAGSGQDNGGPEFLLDKDIVLVTINYRLGALGFLSLEDEILPGNLGLKDQTAALRWVRDNIIYFGGNKDSVTIFGESAGAGSVNLHMMSRLSKGLFHAGISQSGSAHCPWASYPPGLSKQLALKAGKLLGCPTTTSSLLVKCLEEIPYKDLASLSSRFVLWNMHPVSIFRPTVESTRVEDAFLTTYASNSVTSVPLMIGITSDEGSLQLASVTKDRSIEDAMFELDEKFDSLMGFLLMVHEKTPQPDDVIRKIKKFYYGDKKITKDTVPETINMFSDAWFLYGIINALKNHKGPSYLYVFGYQGSNTFSHVFGNKKDVFGVCHVDDLLYLFPCDEAVTKNATTEDREVSEKIIELWTNFATFRHPTPKKSSFTFWEPFSTSKWEYLNITNDGFKMGEYFLKERYEFWNSLNLSDEYTGIRNIYEKMSKFNKDEL